jgi:hypothetical protein
MADHRVILLESAQYGRQVRVRRFDCREEGSVFSPMVAVEGSAESVAVDQEVAARSVSRVVIADGLAGNLQRAAQPLVHLP